jgi:cell division protease FtsH
MDRNHMLNMIAVLFGGRISEEIFMNQMTTGASNDFEVATELARNMVTRYDVGSAGPDGLRRERGRSVLGRSITTYKNVPRRRCARSTPNRRSSPAVRGCAEAMRQPRQSKRWRRRYRVEMIDADQTGDIMDGRAPRRRSPPIGADRGDDDRPETAPTPPRHRNKDGNVRAAAFL